MRHELAELWRFRELLFALIERDLRIRYKNSIFGFFWSLLNPLITVGVMWFVFKFFMKNETPNYSAYILAAYLPYMFFQQSVMDASQSILSNINLVKKVYFPREILPLASVCSNFTHFCLALVVYFVFLIGVYLVDRTVSTTNSVSPFSWNMLWLPIPLLASFVLSVGVALTVSALNTFFEDVKYIVQFMMQLMLFVCPVMYFTESVANSTGGQNSLGYFLYHLNPVAMLCVAFRKILVAPQDVVIGGNTLAWIPLDWRLFGICVLVCFAICIGGYGYFNSRKWRFVERP